MMAQLDSTTKDALTWRLLKVLSARREEIPLSHQQVRAGIDLFDTELESCEQAILAALATDVRTWLTAHQSIAREIVIAVEQARKGEL